MKAFSGHRVLPALLGVVALTACGSPSKAPSSAPPPPIDRMSEEGPEGYRYTDADVQFMQNMILHHAQALEMSRRAPGRTEREDILLLARRIERSQGDEIALMKRWLEARGEELPESGHHPHEHHGHHAAEREHGVELMAGMLTEAQLDQLAATEGPEFDRLFLQLMVYHHEGALDMVEELFSVGGRTAQDPELFQFASHVNSDQRIEITRMLEMLRAGER